MAVDARPKVSVIVPTYNRVERLRRVLQAIADQSIAADDIELIVVSDGSTDGTERYLTGDDLPRPVIALFQENSGPAAARNAGVERATADLLLFIDDDVIAGEQLVAEHLAAHERHPGSVVIGPMLTPADHEMSPWVRWEQAMLYKQYDAMRDGRYTATARQFYTGNASLPRRLIEEVGGFDETFRRAEDIELAYRLAEAGVDFHFHSDATADHYAERSFESWRDIAYQYGRNDIVFARYPGREQLGPFLVWVFEKKNVFVRVATHIALAAPWAGRAITAMMHAAVFVGERCRLGLLTRSALSVIYSIAYHQGMVDDLGGPDAFRRLVRSGGDLASV